MLREVVPLTSSVQGKRSVEEQHLQQQTEGRRIFQLDALRGIAAATVVAYHVRLAEHVAPVSKGLLPFFAGQSAVILFFVLSGFVLSLPYWRHRSQPYPVYLYRRFTRIYLPFLAAMLLSLGAVWMLRGIDPPLTAWFHMTSRAPLTAALMIKACLMGPINPYNTALWSLRLEMQISVVLPLLLWAMRKTHPLLVLVCCLLAGFARPLWLSAWHPGQMLGQTVQTAGLFAVGATLALYEGPLRSALRRLGASAWPLLGLLLFVYFGYEYRGPVPGLERVLRGRYWLVTGLAAAGILLCSLELPPLVKLLRHGVVEYLGRISYSLYLIHGIVLLAAFDLLFGRLPSAVIYVLIGIVSLGFAHLFHALVERPSMAVGKRAPFAGGKGWAEARRGS